MSDEEAHHSGSEGEEGGDKKETKGRMTQRHKMEIRVISLFSFSRFHSLSFSLSRSHYLFRYHYLVLVIITIFCYHYLSFSLSLVLFICLIHFRSFIYPTMAMHIALEFSLPLSNIISNRNLRKRKKGCYNKHRRRIKKQELSSRRE